MLLVNFNADYLLGNCIPSKRTDKFLKFKVSLILWSIFIRKLKFEFSKFVLRMVKL